VERPIFDAGADGTATAVFLDTAGGLWRILCQTYNNCRTYANLMMNSDIQNHLNKKPQNIKPMTCLKVFCLNIFELSGVAYFIIVYYSFNN